MAKPDLGETELKAFVKTDKLLKNPEEFEKLLSKYEQNLLRLAN